MIRRFVSASFVLLLWTFAFWTCVADAQLTYERILHTSSEPQNWLTYSGSYNGWHHSSLNQITRENVGNLKLAWAYQMPTTHRMETTPIVVDGIMYVSSPTSDVFALDAATGRPFWHYRRVLPAKLNVCCDFVNRGVAVLGNRVFIGTIDAHLVALNAKTGTVLWDMPIAESSAGYSITGAPLVVKNMVITGVSGGEYGARCFLEAHDVETGKTLWRFNPIPAPGEPGHETWGPGDAWEKGGGPMWLTGSYDPGLNMLYWGVGNPSPDWNSEMRPGDNLYTDSAVALDPDTGKMKWHFQFIPHDTWDWDAAQIPVLVDADWHGKPRKLVYWAHRAGFFYVLDRVTGEFLAGTQFINQTWTKGLNAKGRPDILPSAIPTDQGIELIPGVQGATNWYSPSFDPQTNLFYLTTWENKGSYTRGNPLYAKGDPYLGSSPEAELTSDLGYGAIRALNPKTGVMAWEHRTNTRPWSGVLSTNGRLIFGASGGALTRSREELESYFYALDSDSGKELWKINLGGTISANPISYSVNGKQMVTIAAGDGIFTFSLP